MLTPAWGSTVEFSVLHRHTHACMHTHMHTHYPMSILLPLEDLRAGDSEEDEWEAVESRNSLSQMGTLGLSEGCDLVKMPLAIVAELCVCVSPHTLHLHPVVVCASFVDIQCEPEHSGHRRKP